MAPNTAPRTQTVAPYDFRRPNKFSREHVRALSIVGETFARRCSTALSTTVRAICQVSVGAVGQLTYDEFISEIPNPSYMTIVELPPLAGSALVHIPLPVIMAAIDKLLGGPGGAGPKRALTEIESSLAVGIVERILAEFAYAFESLAPLQPNLVHQESNPQFAQIAGAAEMVVSIGFDLRIASQSSTMTICIPLTSLQPILDEVGGHSSKGARSDVDRRAVATALASSVERAPMNVALHFDQIILSSREILELRPGNVIALGHGVEEHLTVSVGDTRRFKARVGRRNRRLACQLLEEIPQENSMDLLPAVLA
jgi:flagellar motor switch protein FliM